MISFFGIVIYFVFQILRPHDWVWVSLSTAPIDYFIFSFIIITGFNKLAQNFYKVISSWPFRFICLYLFSIVASNLTNFRTDSILLYAPIFLKLILLYILIACIVDSFNKTLFFIFCISIIISILAYQGYSQIENAVGWAGQTLNWRGSIKWIGDYDGTNSLCVLFNFIIPFLLCFALYPWNFLLRFYGILAGFITLHNIYLTDSRGGMIALLAILILILKDKIKNKFIICISVVLLLSLIIAVGSERITSQGAGDTSARYRIKMWEKGLEVIRYHNRLFGVGYGNFKEYSYRLETHNVFVSNMAEMGLIGLFVWIGMFYSFFKTWLLVKPKIVNHQEQILFYAILVSLLGWLVSAMFLTLRKSMFPIVLFALITSFYNRYDTKEVQITFSDCKKIIGIEIFGILGIWMIERIYFSIY